MCNITITRQNQMLTFNQTAINGSFKVGIECQHFELNYMYTQKYYPSVKSIIGFTYFFPAPADDCDSLETLLLE